MHGFVFTIAAGRGIHHAHNDTLKVGQVRDKDAPISVDATVTVNSDSAA